jgi:uncharacterized membrane protein YkoI
MKRFNRCLALALCGGSMVFATYAEKVRIEEIPLEVRDKILKQTGGARIEDIDKRTQGGRTLYEVAFKRNGQHTELLFDQNGQLQTATTGDAGNTETKVTFEQLPPAVRTVAETRLRGVTPNDIDRRVRNGEVSYEIGFKREGGQQQELLVSQDGRILRDVEISQGSQIIATAAVTNQNAKAVQLSSKRKVEYDTVPDVVKRTVASSSKGARIEDVEVGQWRGRNIYEIAFKDQGQHVELQVEDNGRVFHDPRLASTAAGVPGSTVIGAAASPYPDVKSAVQLSSSQKVDRRSVPAAVEQTLNRVAPGVNVEDIERGSWRGMNVYEVGFKHQGQHVELQIDERGQVVFDPRNR